MPSQGFCDGIGNCDYSNASAPVCDLEGDVNDSGSINVSDLVYLVAFCFQGGPPPVPCP